MACHPGNVGHLMSSMKKPTTLGWYNDTGIFLRRKKGKENQPKA
jgi:hypothetical protein